MAQELRSAVRQFHSAPAFALTAVLTLALGIGANTAVLSLLNALVFRDLAVRDPASLIGISGRSPDGQSRLTPIPAVEDLQRSALFESVCGYNGGVVTAVQSGGIATQAVGAFLTGDCFTVFGILPQHGRFFGARDAPLMSRGAPVAVVSHRLWTRIFGGDRDAVGKSLRLEGVELTIIGVAPPAFAGLHADGVDFFAPFDSVFPTPAGRRPGASHFVARLRPGVTLAHAHAQLTVSWPSILARVVPDTLPSAERSNLRTSRPVVAVIGTGLSSLRDRYAEPLRLMLALTGVLLLLTCLNLGGLMLARLSSRVAEIAVRRAIGGSEWRIARQLVSENLTIAFCGAALSLPIAFMLVETLALFLPAGLVPRSVELTPDGRILLATAILGLLAGLVVSLPPIYVVRSRRGVPLAHIDTRTVTASGRWSRLLLVGQVSVSLTMLGGAALLTRSLYLLDRVDPGVRVDGVLTVRVMPVPNGYSGIDNGSYYPALVDQLSALPGVESVGYARAFPRLTGDAPGQPIAFINEPDGDAYAILETVSPRFFETLGVDVVAGRGLTWDDNARSRPVAIASERLAQMLASDGSIVGRRIRFGADRASQDITIVGVVRNATMGNPRRPQVPVLYRPALQSGGFANYPTFVIATSGSSPTVAADVRRVVREAGREYVHEIVPLREALARAASAERMSAVLAGATAILAGALAFIGTFSLLAYTVTTRRRDIAVRLAVGAQPRQLLTSVVRESLTLTATGIVLGLPLTLMATRLLRSLLFGVTETDPLSLAGAAAALLVLAFAAGTIPAGRAARVDPVIALRT